MSHELWGIIFFVITSGVFFFINGRIKSFNSGYSYQFEDNALIIRGPLMKVMIPYNEIEEAQLVRSCPQGRTLENVLATSIQASQGPSIRLKLARRLNTSRLVYVTPEQPTEWLKQLQRSKIPA